MKVLVLGKVIEDQLLHYVKYMTRNIVVTLVVRLLSRISRTGLGLILVQNWHQEFLGRPDWTQGPQKAQTGPRMPPEAQTGPRMPRLLSEGAS